MGLSGSQRRGPVTTTWLSLLQMGDGQWVMKTPWLSAVLLQTSFCMMVYIKWIFHVYFSFIPQILIKSLVHIPKRFLEEYTTH